MVHYINLNYVRVSTLECMIREVEKFRVNKNIRFAYLLNVLSPLFYASPHAWV